MRRAAVSITVFMGLAALAGCNSLPDMRQPGWLDRPLFERRDPAPQMPADPAREPGTAETACSEAGRSAGFEVRGVVGSSEVTDDTGLAMSRDVMLRVTRGGQTVDVRCSYVYATAEARIMTL
jgi:hypothetical protein